MAYTEKDDAVAELERARATLAKELRSPVPDYNYRQVLRRWVAEAESALATRQEKTDGE